jgi:hypothetical protein
MQITRIIYPEEYAQIAIPSKQILIDKCKPFKKRNTGSQYCDNIFFKVSFL